VGVLGVGLAVGGWWFARRPSATTAPATVALAAVDQGVDPLALGEGLGPLVARVSAAPAGSPRGRAVLEALTAQRQAVVVDDVGEVPPPRAPGLLWRVLPDRTARVTELDLARLVTGVLRAAGESGATVALRLRARRPDEPADPTASLGLWSVRLGDQVLDPAAGLAVGAREAPTVALTDTQLRAAVAAQSALEVAATPGGRAQSLALANAAVEAWPDGAMPLAARARVWQWVGGSSGLDLADADLRAAIAMHDDAGLHLSRARVLLGQRRIAEAAQEARRAAAMSPGWGEAAVAQIAFAPVYARLDAAAPAGCDALRAARARWTDDATVLCTTGTDDTARRAAATRLVADRADPLLLAYAAPFLGDDAAAQLRRRVPVAGRREIAAWLGLFGAHGLAMQLVDEDAGT